jgi:hypothetical protein
MKKRRAGKGGNGGQERNPSPVRARNEEARSTMMGRPKPGEHVGGSCPDRLAAPREQLPSDQGLSSFAVVLVHFRVCLRSSRSPPALFGVGSLRGLSPFGWVCPRSSLALFGVCPPSVLVPLRCWWSPFGVGLSPFGVPLSVFPFRWVPFGLRDPLSVCPFSVGLPRSGVLPLVRVPASAASQIDACPHLVIRIWRRGGWLALSLPAAWS